ncbi:MAG: CPBP family intramembrane metalloprotease [Chitinophagales bacterium]|nr:CPBP family intramembrane metalloprotease [Chitinophagales bacterium]
MSLIMSSGTLDSDRKKVFYYISRLLLLFVAGNLLAQILARILLFIFYPDFKGNTLMALTHSFPSAWYLIRWIQLIHTVFSFGFPSLWIWKIYSGSFKIGLLQRGSKCPVYSIWVILMIICSLPLVQFLYTYNQNIHFIEPLQSIFTNMEHQAGVISKGMLADTSVIAVLFNFFIIVFLASVCEELFFRGVMQKILMKDFSPATAIFIAAFLFSFIHFQFFGFIPRMFLGILLGLIFYHTGHLLFSIIGHFTFNFIQLFIYYLTGSDYYSSIFEKKSSFEYLGVISTIIFITLYISFSKSFLKNSIKNGK